MFFFFVSDHSLRDVCVFCRVCCRFVDLVCQYDHFVVGRRILLICFSLMCIVVRLPFLLVSGRLCSVT